MTKEETAFWKESNELRKDSNYNKDVWQKVREKLGLLDYPTHDIVQELEKLDYVKSPEYLGEVNTHVNFLNDLSKETREYVVKCPVRQVSDNLEGLYINDREHQRYYLLVSENKVFLVDNQHSFRLERVIELCGFDNVN